MLNRFKIALLVLALLPACRPDGPVGDRSGALETGIEELLPPCIVSSLGSRLTVIPAIKQEKIRILPLGTFLPEHEEFFIELAVGGSKYRFPGCNSPENGSVTAELIPGGFRLTWVIPVESLSMTLTFHTLFDPSDLKHRDIPAIWVGLDVANNRSTARNIQVRVHLADRTATFVESGTGYASIIRRIDYLIEQDQVVPGAIGQYLAEHLRDKSSSLLQEKSPAMPVSGVLSLAGEIRQGWSTRSGELVKEADLGPGENGRNHLILAFHTTSPVLQVDGRPNRFAYASRFPRYQDVLSAGLSLPDPESRWTRIADGLNIDKQSREFQNLCSLSMQTFLANTWYVESDTGDLRYSEWEGYPRFHSTLDVAFNNSVFYLMFAPDLLENMLLHWPEYSTDGHMPHDFGKGLVIDKTAYPVSMAIEEDCNFILLEYLYWKQTKKNELIARHADLLANLAGCIMASDLDHNGLPDSGVINTFDDAPRSVNAAKNQTYLGIKSIAALHALLNMIEAGVLPPEGGLSDPDTINRHIDSAIHTIESSYLGDHYPIFIGKQDFEKIGVLLPFNAEKDQHLKKSSEPKVDDGNGCSIYSTSGLLPLLMAGDSGLVDRIGHVREHILASHAETNTLYGDAHASGSANVWISQNIWRDSIAAYLDVDLDFGKLHSQYWAFQMEAARRKTGPMHWEAYCDSPENSFLTAYSRGVDIWLFAAARQKKTLPFD